ncbi:hypothetical protein O6H91_18G014200 [Diphasiastrum complanatum]|uniref:Uncharacterized protein n=1 Tax=Diphasiastrum complanatum TaxID=34168 RepID=A0ACC2AYD4_DIPCM|nr:hypothetical protein O6H91_18G014200 [Diphasiastrum complanatum]
MWRGCRGEGPFTDEGGRKRGREGGTERARERERGWEMQGRQSGPLINLKVSYGLSFHERMILAQASFGEVKRLLVHEIGLRPPEQRLLFRGKEKEDNDLLHVAGIKDKSKVILVEDPTTRERKLEKLKQSKMTFKACKAVAAVSSEVDKLGGRLSIIEGVVQTGNKVPESDFNVLSEMFMRQLLKLDSIEAEGEAKVQRRLHVKRVQNFVEVVNGLKARNSRLQAFASPNSGVTTKWETFEIGVGNLTAPPPNFSRLKTD